MAVAMDGWMDGWRKLETVIQHLGTLYLTAYKINELLSGGHVLFGPLGREHWFVKGKGKQLKREREKKKNWKSYSNTRDIIYKTMCAHTYVCVSSKALVRLMSSMKTHSTPYIGQIHLLLL